MLRILLERLREPSTMAGLSVLVTLAGGGAKAEPIVQAVAAAAGILAVFLPEKAAK